MDIKELEKIVSPLVIMTVKILLAITNKLNLPETICFYRLLVKHPRVRQYIKEGG